ncbi:MAG: DNA repair protein RecN [Clostridiales bacterium]|nr:DNA repair protein RecN [Clostridiales bacterium]
MLQTLKIENVALIDKAILNFDERLNVISGETGAGKSIMLDSLSFVFGGRADRSLIRSGAESMKVEAIFNNLTKKHIDYIQKQFNIDTNDELFLSRELDSNGRNVCKINDELVPVSTVKKICQLLVDIHGQSEHLAILNNDYQLKIIDLFSKKADDVLSILAEKIEKYKDNEKQINLLGGSEVEKQNLIDLYSYQIQEIENADIKEGEYESLTEEKKELGLFEKINECLRACYEASGRSNFSETASEKLSSALHAIQPIKNINNHYQELANRLNSVRLELEDINETINDDLNNRAFDKERFDFVDSRLDFIKSLFRKYGGDFAKFSQYYQDIKIKLDNLINSNEKYQKLLLEKENILNEIDTIQDRLSNIRRDSAKTLKVRIQEELRALGMPNAKVDIEFGRIDERFSINGYDKVEFMFSSNLGFELKPLNKVVSGGEMSRVMLAYKIVVSSVDDIHSIVFDEIDSGLSGNIATVVAEYMARLGKNKQIIAVSHLPQICAMADTNIKVEKYSDRITTHTRANILKDKDLYSEIARLMGVDSDDLGLSVAKDLKEKSDKYKEKIK